MPRAKTAPGAAPPGGQGSILVPFTVVIDTREQLPYAFAGLTADAKQKNAPLVVPTVRKAIHNGDYSIEGLEDRIGVERKSKEDLYGSVTRRDNFEQRLERMTALRLAAKRPQDVYFAVLVEAELYDCLKNRPRFSRTNPKALNRTILAWRQRYLVDWYFVPDRLKAEAFVYRILERFYADAHKLGKTSPCAATPTRPAVFSAM